MIKAVIFDGGGTIWYSMKVLYEHYKIAALYFGLIRSLEDFPYSLELMNELSSLRSFNSRKNIAKIITAMLMKKTTPKDLDNLLNLEDPERGLLDLISELVPDQKFWKIATDMGIFLEKALYNYPEEWYPLCEGVKETLPDLKSKGYKIALLSNRRKGSVMKILKSNKIDKCFDYIHAPEEGEPLKKEFGPITAALEVQLNECVFVGDSLLDIKSAKEMGNIKVIATLSGMGTQRMFTHLPAEYKPDCVIPDVKALISCI